MPQEEEILSTSPPPNWIPCGPHVSPTTMLQSVATTLHLSTQPFTGQQDSLESLEQSPGICVNSEQPLIQVGSFLKDKL